MFKIYEVKQQKSPGVNSKVGKAFFFVKKKEKKRGGVVIIMLLKYFITPR